MNGRNQAFNHAGNMVGAALSGYLGYKFGYVAVFVLAAVFGAIAIACVLMIPANSIDDRQARGSKEDESKNPPDGMSVLLKHKPLLVLALALAIFHLGNAAIVPLYGLAAVAEGQANGPSFVATTVVIAQGVMVVTSLIAIRRLPARARRAGRPLRRFARPRPSARACRSGHLRYCSSLTFSSQSTFLPFTDS
ncbi:MFS family permease [Bradyrhizobium diazoefficiens]